MKKVLRIIGLCLLALFVAYTLYYLWQKSQPLPTVYELVGVGQRTIVKRTTVAGSMEARRQVAVRPQTTGFISQLRVEPGDRVKAGDIIAKVGSSGRSTGPHLHLELTINGENVNPLDYIIIEEDTRVGSDD